MTVETRGHWIGGTFPEEDSGEHFAKYHTMPVDPENPTIIQSGQWFPEELRFAHHPLGSVAIFGHCLASQDQVESHLAQALEKNDDRRLTCLPGSYTAILQNKESVTIYADLANQFPVYYREEKGHIHFSSLAEPLRSGNWQPDSLALAALIGTPWTGQLTSGRSFTRGISRLEAGHRIHINKNGSMSIGVYEDFTPSTPLSVDEAAYNLREALVESTQLRARLDQKIVSDFSGGLDSTSLAFLLSQEVDDQLPIVTFHSPEVPSADLNYVRRYLQLSQSQDRFDWNEFSISATGSVYDNLLNLSQTDEPDVSVAERGRALRLFAFLKEKGYDLHVTGNGADGIVDLEPTYYLGDLFKVGQMARFITSSIQAARSAKGSPINIALSSLFLRNPSQELLIVGRALRAHELGHRALAQLGVAPQWLSRQAQDLLAEYAFAQSHNYDAFAYGLEGGNRRAYDDVRSLGMALHGTMQIAGRAGMREHTPFMDNAVLRACFSIPAHERINPRIFKSFLRKALNGIVPDQVLSRNTKGGFGRLSYQSLRNAAPVFEHMLENSRLADLGIVDPNVVQDTLHKAYAGGIVPWVSLDGFVASELWLRHHYPDSNTLSYGVALPTNQEPYRAQEIIQAPHASSNYSIPSDVIVAARENGGIALNIRRGTYHRLNNEALRVVEALQNAANLDEALQNLIASYPIIAKDTLRNGMMMCIRQLLAQGVLQEGVGNSSILMLPKDEELAQETVMARPTLETAQTTALTTRLAAFGGFILANVLKQFPFQRQVNILNKISDEWIRRPATASEAEETLSAIHNISRFYLGRVACLELAMSTSLALALRRKEVQTVLGIRSDPDSFHAWPEASGTPIRTELDEHIKGIYQPILKIG